MFVLKSVRHSIRQYSPRRRFLPPFVLLLVALAVHLSAVTALAATNRSHVQSDRPTSIEQPISQSLNCGVSVYRVKPGDTLSAIARRHNTTSRGIRQCNGLKSSVVYVGQVLSIPGAASSSSESDTPKARVTRSYTAPTGPSSSSSVTQNPYYRPRRATPVPNR